MRKLMMLSIASAVLLSIFASVFVPDARAGASIQVDGPRVVYWGDRPVFDITVSGESGVQVKLAPWLVSLSGEDTFTFSAGRDTWHVKATVSDEFYKNQAFASAVISRSTIPGKDPVLPLVYEKMAIYSWERKITSFWRPIAKRVFLKNVPADVLADIFQAKRIYTQGSVVYDYDGHNLTLKSSTIAIYNKSSFDVVLSLPYGARAVKYENYNASKRKIYPDGWVLLDLGDALHAKAYEIAQKFGKGTKDVEIGMMSVFDNDRFSLKVPLKVCQNGDCEMDGYGKPRRTWCGSVRSALLDYLADEGQEFIAAPIDDNILVVYDGVSARCVSTDAPATIKNGRTLVPMRFFLEALGAKLWWVPAQKKVVTIIPHDTSTDDSYRYWQNVTKIEMWIGYSKARVNGAVYNMPSGVPPQIIHSRTYVPLRFVGEVSGWRAEWDSEARVAVIHK